MLIFLRGANCRTLKTRKHFSAPSCRINVVAISAEGIFLRGIVAGDDEMMAELYE